MFGGFFGGFDRNGFEARYRAMPVSFIEKPGAENGDKVILPPSALDRLASLHVEYPMLFRVENLDTSHHTHCGVLEFVADEGTVYMPYWMMQNLCLEVGQMVKFGNVSLPKGTYVKLQPSTSDFLDISNPKAVLERALRSYSCLTKGDCFVIEYNNKKYEIEVKECRPQDAISVIETDCQVDFDAPKDYKEPERVPPPAAQPMQTDDAGAQPGQAAGQEATAEPEEEEDDGPKFVPFVGSGRRLDGKPASSSDGASTSGASGPAAAAAARAAAAATAGSSKPAAPKLVGSKSGTVVNVSTGNRLLDKLEREKAAKQGAAPAAPPPPPAEEPQEGEDAKSSFKAFIGKGYSLKG